MKSEIDKFRIVRDELDAALIEFPEDKRLSVLFNQWSLKDVVSHLNHWMEHDISCLRALVEDKEPEWEEDIDKFNKSGIEARYALGWEIIYQEFTDLCVLLIASYEALPEKLWDREIWEGKNLSPRKFLQDDIAHWGEHLEDIKAKNQI